MKKTYAALLALSLATAAAACGGSPTAPAHAGAPRFDGGFTTIGGHRGGFTITGGYRTESTTAGASTDAPADSSTTERGGITLTGGH